MSNLQLGFKKPKFVIQSKSYENTRRIIEQINKGDLVFAENLARKILKKEPKNAEMLRYLGIIYQKKEELDKSILYLKEALKYDPEHVETLSNLGNAYQQLNKISAALKYINQALLIDPSFGPALFNKAVCYFKVGEFAESIYTAHLGLLECPNDLLGIQLVFSAAYHLREWYEAEIYLIKALDIVPNDLYMMNQLSSVLHLQGKLDQAIEVVNKVIKVDPQHKSALANRALYLKSKGLFKDAIKDLEFLLELNPDNEVAEMSLSELILLYGDYLKGWKLYESRKKIKDWNFVFSSVFFPEYTGAESLEGKKILVTAEQGYGDNIQFSRYIPLLAEKGAEVYFGIQDDVQTILSTVGGITKFVKTLKEIPNHCVDYQITLLSLPLAFKTTLDNIPTKVRYLSADTILVKEWGHKLSVFSKPKIGIVWCGAAGNQVVNPDYLYPTVGKSIHLKEFEILSDIDADFISLQKGEESLKLLRNLLEENWSGPEIHNFDKEITDFDQTAAIIENLDLVITVCTSVAHLSGALGKPTWILLKKDACWRWLLDRDDSPWYPTVKLFRQPEAGDWAGALNNLKKDLQVFVRDCKITKERKNNE